MLGINKHKTVVVDVCGERFFADSCKLSTVTSMSGKYLHHAVKDTTMYYHQYLLVELDGSLLRFVRHG